LCVEYNIEFGQIYNTYEKERKMNEVTIVHLSDLHLTKTENGKVPELYVKLIDDIKTYINEWNGVILVVTGDIVDRGEYEAREVALDFFKRIKIALKSKCKGIHIVSGNHDVKIWKEEDKTDKIREWLNAIESESVLDKEFYIANKEIFDEYSEEYISLINEIYDIFKRDKIEKQNNIKIDKIGRTSLCFIEGFSALNSGRGGDKDKRHIRFGEYQLKTLWDEINKEKAKTGNSSELTFLLLHHPMNWLAVTEEEQLHNYTLSKTTFDVDFVLCGHTHIQDIYHVNKNYKSMMTLATGIGWKESEGAERLSRHRYAIYNLNLDANSMEIYNRYTNEAGVFAEDISLYNEEQIEEMQGKIILPLKMNKSKGYFDVSTVNGRTNRPFFYSSDIIKDFHNYRTKLNQWFYDAGDYLHRLRDELYEEIEMNEREKVCGCFNKDKQIGELEERRKQVVVEMEYVKNFLGLGTRIDKAKWNTPSLLNENEYKIKIYKKLDAYLQYLCERLSRLLFEDAQIVRGRVHFRYGYVNNEEIYYKKLCAYGFYKGKGGEQEVSETIWGDMIEAAFNTQHALIYSVNKGICKNKLHKDWDNYLTAVPQFAGNRIRHQHGKGMGSISGVVEERPLLSFGITIKGKRCNILYYLDYINISKAIGDLISDFIRYTGISFQDFIYNYVGESYD